MSSRKIDGFKMKCEKCGSTQVEVQTSSDGAMGEDAEISKSIVCKKCGNSRAL